MKRNFVIYKLKEKPKLKHCYNNNQGPFSANFFVCIKMYFLNFTKYSRKEKILFYENLFWQTFRVLGYKYYLISVNTKINA